MAFSYDFDLYADKQSDVIPDGEKNIGTSSNVVLRLTQTVPENLYYRVFFDNWFTSVELMIQMDKKGILPLGTVRAKRLPGAKLPTKKDLLQKGRGSAVEVETDIDDRTLTVVSWLDNKVVNICSRYVGRYYPSDTVKRFNRKKKCYEYIICPRTILLYNRHMEGVDTLDSMLGYYRIKVRSKKWYMRVISYDRCHCGKFLVDLETFESRLVHATLGFQIIGDRSANHERIPYIYTNH